MPDRQLRLLMLAPFPPRTDGLHGGSRAIAALVTELAEDHAIALLYLRSRDEPDIDEPVRQACARAHEVRRAWSYTDSRLLKAFQLGAGLLQGIPTWVRRWHTREFSKHLPEILEDWRPDVLQADFHVMGQYIAPGLAPGLPKILVQHESGTAAAAERARRSSGAARLLAKADHRAWSLYERRVGAMFDRVVTFTRRDADAVGVADTKGRVVTIPLGVRVPLEPSSPTGTDGTIVFIGSFVHYPNEDAAARLATRILPLVHAQVPSATLHIVGSATTEGVEALAGERVRVHGSVPDVTPYLDEAAVVAVPLRLGSGMRVKVLDALAAGKAIVCSRLAIDGLSVRDRLEVKLAEDDVEFANAIVELLESPGQRRELATRARQWAVEHASSRRTADSFRALYNQLLHEHTAGRGVHSRSGIALPVR